MNGQDLFPAPPAPASVVHLLERRLALTAGVAALTARMQRLIRETSGIEMEVLRLEIALGAAPGDGELARELQEVLEKETALRSAQLDCLQETVAAEDAIAEVDRLIAVSNGGQT
ncbi:hypothetical protein [Ensifer soli]|uniref:hypothetical protein n=1 Tax=Ciceribacter sp. sgz301302 TaxID=3342379 RepID=UPI0035B7E71E